MLSVGAMFQSSAILLVRPIERALCREKERARNEPLSASTKIPPPPPLHHMQMSMANHKNGPSKMTVVLRSFSSSFFG